MARNVKMDAAGVGMADDLPPAARKSPAGIPGGARGRAAA